ncbi:DUF4148 domain-containing protein [Paraburkholderia sp. MMS20-SJTR3]|uniref:DUF4148 domain-containing protein n=1 Tax=Paraburkholderia sejongensis TaxID=2886946 RepID=A0ABS8JZA0_9BURK|nr:DUF4148 domain-containing protein [Paraburkholderia sp. MMS20-SJTR3]MCC8395226.1 DUF4148 domain-containing protein [Paraburkholderia sp. MMS20-SJTR3]
MKCLFKAAVIGISLAASVSVFAQSNAPITRAQVRAELIQLERNGYHVGDGDQAHYPEAIQEAEARIAARNGAAASAYGGAAAGSVQAGGPAVDGSGAAAR